MKRIITSLLLVCSSVYAQSIEVVVSAAPGGPNDTVTRRIVDRLEKQTNLQFVVINRPGAAHTIAYNYVSLTSKPTLLIETPEIEKHEVFNQVDELFNTGHFYNILLVSSSSGIKNINNLIDLSKQREIVFGHGGVGSYSHAAAKQMCEKTLRCLDVPFKGAAEGMLSLMSGTIDAYAVVSYGSKQFTDNEKYHAIYNIKLGKEKSWYKMFSKNLPEKDRQTIISVLKSFEGKFFTDMGLDR